MGRSSAIWSAKRRRWVALEPSNLLRSALRYDRACNWDEFRAALGDWSVPAHNFVYADVEGNIGCLQAGWLPIRAKGYGLAPVPGWTGEYEWQGYLSLDELPQAYNPESGWLVTANNLVVDTDYPHFLSAGLENPCRARRIVDLITSKARLTADDFSRFQRDTFSAQAGRFVRHLLTLEPRSDQERRALTYLKNWDRRMGPNSMAAPTSITSRLNRALFAHPVGSVKPLNLIFNRGPYPIGGDHDTLLRASGQPRYPFEPVMGADSLRFIADLSDWENCHIVIPGGQSGHVASRHYADLIPLWLEGRFLPMPFKRTAVERRTRRRLTLVPDE